MHHTFQKMALNVAVQLVQLAKHRDEFSLRQRDVHTLGSMGWAKQSSIREPGPTQAARLQCLGLDPCFSPSETQGIVWIGKQNTYSLNLSLSLTQP